MAALDSLLSKVTVFPGIRACKKGTYQQCHLWSEECGLPGLVCHHLVGAELSLYYLEFKFRAFMLSLYTCCLYKHVNSREAHKRYDSP